jgi:hypothetical protein
MAVSDVSICNLAIQMTGGERINSLDDTNSTEARECNSAYTDIRDAELRAHPWAFAIRRVQLAPDVTAPAFDFAYAFTKPSDCLKILPPNDRWLDWHYESNKILTNAGDTLNLRYIKRVVDPAQFDSLFVRALAARLALHLVETITQSNTKKQAIAVEYRSAISEARRANSFEQISSDPPVDSWVAARETGSWNGGQG